MECRVEYDYTAQEEDELSLKKGDIIINVNQKLEGWWEGTLRETGKTGMFPDNFVKISNSDSKSSSSTSSSTPATGEPVVNTESESSNGVQLRSNKNKRQLKALFSYAPEQEDELKLDIGDVIEFVAEVEEGWWRGRLKGRVGIFPSNFVSDYEPITNGKGSDPEQKLNDMNKMNNTKGVPDVPPAVPSSAPPLEDEPAPELPPKPVRELARCFYPYQGQNEDELTLKEGDIVTIISKNCEDEGWWRGELKGKNGLFPDNFVKIEIEKPNESSANQKANLNFTSGTSNATKISPQAGGRNLKGVQPLVSGGGIETNVTDKTSGSSVVDGMGNSKMPEKEKEKPMMSKIEATKALFSKSFSSSPKPATPTSPVNTGFVGGFGKSEIKKEASFGKGDRKSDEEDFNSIERGEKLNHLTAKRAKAPKRRPPSTLIPRDNDVSLTNGSFHSHESIDSPPANHSTPYNSTLNSSASAYGTPSGSILDTSAVSGGGSFLSQSKDNDTSATSPANGNTSAGATKPKKLLPWMAELKQKQDKKIGLTSPVSSTPPNGNYAITSSSVASPTSLPALSSSTPPSKVTKDKEAAPLPVPVKAPPLPAKPSSLATSVPNDKASSVSPSVPAIPAPAPSVTNRVFGKKPPPVSPMQGMPNNFLNSVGGHDNNTGGGDSKQFVPYEEYAKLRDRVVILEAELETVRRQVKILLDRELSHGHIV